MMHLFTFMAVFLLSFAPTATHANLVLPTPTGDLWEMCHTTSKDREVRVVLNGTSPLKDYSHPDITISINRDQKPICAVVGRASVIPSQATISMNGFNFVGDAGCVREFFDDDVADKTIRMYGIYGVGFMPSATRPSITLTTLHKKGAIHEITAFYCGSSSLGLTQRPTPAPASGRFSGRMCADVSSHAAVEFAFSGSSPAYTATLQVIRQGDVYCALTGKTSLYDGYTKISMYGMDFLGDDWCRKAYFGEGVTSMYGIYGTELTSPTPSATQQMRLSTLNPSLIRGVVVKSSECSGSHAPIHSLEATSAPTAINPYSSPPPSWNPAGVILEHNNRGVNTSDSEVMGEESIIILAAVGFFVLLVLIIVGLVFVCKKRNETQTATPQHHASAEPREREPVEGVVVAISVEPQPTSTDATSQKKPPYPPSSDTQKL